MKTRLIVFVASLLFVGNTLAQESFEKAQALFIYNFTRFIGWPIESLSGEFVIGVLGDKSLYEAVFVTTMGKSVGVNKIVVKSFSTPEEHTPCHILVIGVKYRSKTEEIKNKLGNAPTLMINAGDGRISKASGIGFKMVDDKMKFEMYLSNIKNAGLVVSSQLEKMGIILD